MNLKKRILVGASILVMSMPFAYADLITHNETNESSTVRVTSGYVNPCAGSIGEYTPAKTTKGVSWDKVNKLCLTSGDTCVADIYMDSTCDGPVVGHASLNLKTKKVFNVSSVAGSKYDISGQGSEVFLKYKS